MKHRPLKPRRTRRPTWPVIVCALALLLSACAPASYEPTPCPAPAIVEYPPEFREELARALEHFEADPAFLPIKTFLWDCISTRAQIRACQEGGHEPD